MEWISIKEKLPKPFVEVLILLNSSIECRMCVASWDGEDNMFFPSVLESIYMINFSGKEAKYDFPVPLTYEKEDIDYWMPLPEPPKE